MKACGPDETNFIWNPASGPGTDHSNTWELVLSSEVVASITNEAKNLRLSTDAEIFPKFRVLIKVLDRTARTLGNLGGRYGEDFNRAKLEAIRLQVAGKAGVR